LRGRSTIPFPIIQLDIETIKAISIMVKLFGRFCSRRRHHGG
jgi:hypothetical protein